MFGYVMVNGKELDKPARRRYGSVYCGICRQLLSEFCDSDMPVILGDENSYKVYTLGELLPLSFILPD